MLRTPEPIHDGLGGSAERVVTVVEYLSRCTSPVSAATIAQRCRIPRSTLYELLADLDKAGWVERCAGRRGWVLGRRIRQVGAGAPLLADGLLVLRCFDSRVRYLTIDDIAQRTGLLTDTVRAAASALESESLITGTGDGSYALGLGLLNLAGRVAGLEPLRSCALPYLTRLRDETGETAVLLVPDGDGSMCIELVESHHPLRHTGWVGKRVSLAGTATGAALAGSRGGQVADGVVEEGVTAISCLVEGSSNPPAVLSISGPSFRIRGETLALARAAVEAAAHDLGLELLSLTAGAGSGR